jgi:hypothetical protein
MEAVVNEIPSGGSVKLRTSPPPVPWLCTPGAGFTNGQALVVDGGYTVP